MMTSNEIRQKFLDFFASKGHTIVPSAPMVVKNDPTLMFTNAGMNQFKDIFLGNVAPKTHRATDSQKCLRVSGKHNDLEEVGHDSYHHTMFEMLGNWSFGDYFKTEAISWAWELLTEVYKIDKTKLYATVFEGSAEDGTSLDEEAHRTWLKFLPEDHILLGNKHDNFWEMGDTGPCGPCSEIHIDLRSDEEIAAVPGRELVNKSNPLVIEIWNLVFMQYNRKANGELELLPNHNIDTGMGFERLCMVLQGKKSNYDTDVFTGMISKIEELSGHGYHESEDTEVAMRVIADHIRAISFSIADGQLPSNVKAGYVIRRILRRAVRYGYTFLGFNEPFLCRLVQQLADDMGGAYPELRTQQKLIESVIREEEFAFLRTLDRGIRLMDDYLEKAADTKVIDGKDAFVLYDTYGFPIDLTELIASEKGYKVDLEAFNVELQKQKELCEIIAGLDKMTDGDIEFDGDSIKGLDPRAIIRKGISMSFVPEDRLGMGLVAGMSITNNVILKSYNHNPGPFIDSKFAKKLAEQIVHDFDIYTPSVNYTVKKLSGGNIQKVLLGREIWLSPKVLITAYPVRGLDIGASYNIYHMLNEQKKKGVAVLFIGEDLDVLKSISDRLMVIHDGEIIDIVDPTTVTKEDIGLMMVGDHINKGKEKAV